MSTPNDDQHKTLLANASEYPNDPKQRSNKLSSTLHTPNNMLDHDNNDHHDDGDDDNDSPRPATQYPDAGTGPGIGSGGGGSHDHDRDRDHNRNHAGHKSDKAEAEDEDEHQNDHSLYSMEIGQTESARIFPYHRPPHPPIPWKTALFAIFLLVVGIICVSLGFYFLSTGKGQTLAFFLVGFIALIPGVYQTFVLCQAWRRVPGYTFTNVSDAD